jgi:transcriptional regulator with XRE-family HTH domain
MELFGEKLRYLRRQLGMTQVELARKTSLRSHTHVAKLEAGQRSASLSLVIRFADVLGVTTDYLLRDSILVAQGRAQSVPSSVPSSLPEVGARIRKARLQASMTQVDMAHRLGLAQQAYVSNIEAGRREPSPELLVQIADLFNTTTDALLRGNSNGDAGSPDISLPKAGDPQTS